MSAVTKKFVTFILIMLVAIAAIICCVYVLMTANHNNSNDKPSTVSSVELSAAQINKEVIEKMGYTGISELASGDVSGHIDIPEDSITQVSFYVSDSSSSATEIACFKLKDPDDDEALLAAISDHISTKLKGFQDSPKESEYIKNYQTKTENGYVFMVVSENSDVAVKTFLDTVV